MSSLSDAIKRTSEVLKLGVSTQVLDYEQRFSSLKTLYDDLLSDFVRMKFDCEKAHETASARGMEAKCSAHVETLLRQGRKYGLGVCIATQRIAYLNTNALQQIHTYFVGTLPRPYDRQLVSDTFMIDKNILEKTLEFAPGEWLLSSYIATGMENVPIFIKADNAEHEIKKHLKKAA